ncbi:MAG: hypothetical protein KGJ77_00630 [Acidobacteriota bacterium]|nr:hypothetical protein [Acidobacteriota bacterium]
MTDLRPAPVPDPGDEWLAARRHTLVETLAHPPRRLAVPVTVAAAVAAATTAATTVVVVGGSTTSAFAGWSAAPTAPVAEESAVAQSACLSRAAQAQPANEAIRDGQPVNKTPVPLDTLTPVVTDTRGPYTVTVFQGTGGLYASCLTGPGSTVSTRQFVAPTTPVPADQVAVDLVAYRGLDGGTYTLIQGRAGPGVEEVRLVLDDGTTVEATEAGGLFVAWWPGDEGIGAAELTTAAGTSTQPLDLAGPRSRGGQPAKP